MSWYIKKIYDDDDQVNGGMLIQLKLSERPQEQEQLQMCLMLIQSMVNLVISITAQAKVQNTLIPPYQIKRAVLTSQFDRS